MIHDTLLTSSQSLPPYSLDTRIFDPDYLDGGVVFSGGNNFGWRVVANSQYIVVSMMFYRVHVYNAVTKALLYTLSGNGQIFGSTIAISETHLIVGNWHTGSIDGYENSGTIYVYRLSDGILLRTILNPNQLGNSREDRFGHRVAISSLYTAASAPHELSPVPNLWAGVVYIHSIGTGALVATINNPNSYGTGSYDEFGEGCVVMNDSYLCVSSINEDNAVESNTGAIYVFNTGTFTLVRTILNPEYYDSPTPDVWGDKMYLYGTKLLVGVPSSDLSGHISNAGVAHLYELTTGALLHTFVNPRPIAPNINDFFGAAVVMNDQYIIIRNASSLVHVYDANTYTLLNSVATLGTGNVNLDIADMASDTNTYTCELAINNNHIIVSDPYKDYGTIVEPDGYTHTVVDCGEVYLYKL